MTYSFAENVILARQQLCDDSHFSLFLRRCKNYQITYRHRISSLETFDPELSSDYTIILWNPITGKIISTLKVSIVLPVLPVLPVWPTESVESVAFSPDGKTLATGSHDNTIKLWNLDLDDLLEKGCDYLEEYLASRDELREELCPQE